MKGYNLPQRNLVSQNDSSIIQDATIPRSVFRGSWNHITAFNAGVLIPFMVQEILPGDHMTYNVVAYVRMSTPLFPLFSNQRVDTHFFFTPSRILWTNWVKFMGEQANPGDSIAYTVPYISSPVGGFATASIYDYMGIPGENQILALSSVNINALPLRAYNRIYNEWFRDQNLTTRAIQNTGDGPDADTDYVLQRRAKSHDYFTSALPSPQKFTAPTVPILGSAPISGLGSISSSYDVSPQNNVKQTAPLVTTNYDYALLSSGTEIAMRVNATGTPNVYADLTQATGVAINTFRQAFLTQQLMERDARGGTRYVELLRSHFGVISPDYRLQRPEYIGGGQSPIAITPIAQTAPTTGVPLGALGAAGTAAGSHRASYAATEHGYILGLISVKSELTYQQGLHKMWTRSTRYDFYWPSLAGLGEQAILMSELYVTGDDPADAVVFGYQERWHEYRAEVSRTSGIMRSTATGAIDQWHLGQEFGSTPALNTPFIEDDPPMTRVLAAGSNANGQQYLADILIQRTAVRPIPSFGTPVLLGRF